MENVRIFHNYKVEHEEWKKDIDEKLDYLLKVQEGVLTQQEIQTFKMLDMDEKMKLILDNQQKQTEQLNKLMEGWNK